MNPGYSADTRGGKYIEAATPTRALLRRRGAFCMPEEEEETNGFSVYGKSRVVRENMGWRCVLYSLSEESVGQRVARV